MFLNLPEIVWENISVFYCSLYILCFFLSQIYKHTREYKVQKISLTTVRYELAG